MISFRLLLLMIIALLNWVALWALFDAAARWVAPGRYRRVRNWIGIVVLLLNLPLIAFFIRSLDLMLERIPSSLLRIFFYPASAWLATIMLFFLIAAPVAVALALRRALAAWRRKRKDRISGSSLSSPPQSPALSRRGFLGGAPGLLIPGIYGAAAYGAYANLDQIDISQEYSIPIPHLARSLEGLTIVQLSDLHVGPYIREKDLQHIVSLTNQLHPDLVVITGDVLDRHLSSLPDAVNGLRAIRAPLGIFAVLGNHDYYADRFSFSAEYRGGIEIAKGLESVGIRTLRNQVVHLGEGADKLALLGLDWLTSGPGDRNFFRYRPVETRQQLSRMTAQVGPDTPQILLAHHPDTFLDVPAGIGLTLSGHTHGGGQVLVGHIAGVPIGVATLRFKYLSGLYQERGSSLYVNRGIGYLGIPIRINCPPEISRFKLITPTSTGA